MNYALTHPGRVDSHQPEEAEQKTKGPYDTAKEPRGGAHKKENKLESIDQQTLRL